MLVYGTHNMSSLICYTYYTCHDDVIKWRHFPRYWPFVRGIHRSPVNSPHKGQWRGALMLSLMYAKLNVWVNTREAGDLRRYRIHYDVIVMHTPLSTRRNMPRALGLFVDFDMSARYLAVRCSMSCGGSLNKMISHFAHSAWLVGNLSWYRLESCPENLHWLIIFNFVYSDIREYLTVHVLLNR